MTTAINYNNYQSLIQKLAWSWSNKLNMEQEDLFSEGNVVFCSIVDKYQDTKGKFSTFLVNSINNHFRNMLHKQMKITIIPNPKNVVEQTPETEAEFWSNVNSLSNEAQDVVDIVLSGPNEIRQMGNLKKHLREAGWAWRTIFDSVNEIKGIFK